MKPISDPGVLGRVADLLGRGYGCARVGVMTGVAVGQVESIAAGLGVGGLEVPDGRYAHGQGTRPIPQRAEDGGRVEFGERRRTGGLLEPSRMERGRQAAKAAALAKRDKAS